MTTKSYCLGLKNNSEDYVDKDHPEYKLELLRRKHTIKMEKDFASFAKEAWKVLNPEVELVDEWYIDAICSYLQALHDGELEHNFLIINQPPRTLKALALDTLVATPKGLVPIEHIHPGDYVFSKDGSPTLVLGESKVNDGRLLRDIVQHWGKSSL